MLPVHQNLPQKTVAFLPFADPEQKTTTLTTYAGDLFRRLSEGISQIILPAASNLTAHHVARWTERPQATPATSHPSLLERVAAATPLMAPAIALADSGSDVVSYAPWLLGAGVLAGAGGLLWRNHSIKRADQKKKAAALAAIGTAVAQLRRNCSENAVWRQTLRLPTAAKESPGGKTSRARESLNQRLHSWDVVNSFIEQDVTRLESEFKKLTELFKNNPSLADFEQRLTALKGLLSIPALSYSNSEKVFITQDYQALTELISATKPTSMP